MRPTAPYGVKSERITAGFMKGGTRERYITPDLSFLSDDGGKAFPSFVDCSFSSEGRDAASFSRCASSAFLDGKCFAAC